MAILILAGMPDIDHGRDWGTGATGPKGRGQNPDIEAFLFFSLGTQRGPDEDDGCDGGDKAGG